MRGDLCWRIGVGRPLVVLSHPACILDMHIDTLNLVLDELVDRVFDSGQHILLEFRDIVCRLLWYRRPEGVDQVVEALEW